LPCRDLNNASAATLRQVNFGLSQVPWNGSVWRARFPELAQSIAQSVYCVPWQNTITGNQYTGVECDSFPCELDRASKAEQASWHWQVSNNSNTVACPPLKQDDDDGNGVYCSWWGQRNGVYCSWAGTVEI
jgi:hypothetical protein